MNDNSRPDLGEPRDDPRPVQSDSTLVRRIRCGEDDAATALFLRYARRIENIARRETAADLKARFDADDVVQSVFRTFFRRTAEGEYAIPQGDELWKLLLVITLNKIRALSVHHRAQKRSASRTVTFDPSQEESQLGEVDASHLLLLQGVIDELLQKMPQVHREIVQQRIDGEALATIADNLKRSRRTVERVLQQFRETLRESLETEGGVDDRTDST